MPKYLRSLAISILLCGVSFACSAQGVPAEELEIRALYAQVVMASYISAFRDGKVPETFSIELSDFKNGPLDAIAGESLADVVTIPSGEVLMSTPGRWSFNGEPLCSMLVVEGWRPYTSRYSGVESVNWRDPVADILKGRDQSFDRYAAYSVTVSFAGKTKQYKALAFFSGSTGIRTPLIADYTLDGTVPSGLALQRDFPNCLARMPAKVDRRMEAAAKEFVESVRIPSNCRTEEYTGLCCEPDGGKCGLPQGVGPR